MGRLVRPIRVRFRDQIRSNLGVKEPSLYKERRYVIQGKQELWEINLVPISNSSPQTRSNPNLISRRRPSIFPADVYQAIKVQNATGVILDAASGQELQQKVALALIKQAHA